MAQTNMVHLADFFRELLLKRLRSVTLPESLVEIVKLIAFAQNDYRFYLLTENQQVDDLWNRIREHEVLVDFMMGLSAELHFKMGAEVFQSINEGLADAIALNNSNASNMDDDLLERTTTTEFMYEKLKNNAWLMVLVLFTFMDAIEVLLTQLTVVDET